MPLLLSPTILTTLQPPNTYSDSLKPRSKSAQLRMMMSLCVGRRYVRPPSLFHLHKDVVIRDWADLQLGFPLSL